MLTFVLPSRTEERKNGRQKKTLLISNTNSTTEKGASSESHDSMGLSIIKKKNVILYKI